MIKDNEIDMKDVELSELDPEKQPMTGDTQAAGGEKNGTVKLKVPEDEVTFTGLSKEELMKVAGTTGWVRIRWMLLVLFWLGWVGMLAGAIVIIVRAPRCKPIPEMNWWNEGPLYQIPDVQAFSEEMTGVESKLDYINQLKVKGLILGPLHIVQEDVPVTLDLGSMHPDQGSEGALLSLLQKAHRKGISVMLDLTPNYNGIDSWFTDVDDTVEKVQVAAEYWLGLGVDGIKVSDLKIAFNSSNWSSLQDAVQTNRTKDDKKRALMGVAKGLGADEVSQLANSSGVDIILPDLLSTNPEGKERIMAMEVLDSQQRGLGWGLGAAQLNQLSVKATTTALIQLYQLLLFSMPGIPVFTYGDEIGLAKQGLRYPKMVWDIETENAEGAAVNNTAEAERKEYGEIKKWFISLSDLRGKERSLLHGDYYPLYSSATSLSFLRLWDQSERYITAVNWGEAPETITFTLTPKEGVALAETATVRLSTDENLPAESTVKLDKISLGPGQAVLLQFPYST